MEKMEKLKVMLFVILRSLLIAGNSDVGAMNVNTIENKFAEVYQRLKFDIYSNYPNFSEIDNGYPVPRGSRIVKDDMYYPFGEKGYAIITPVEVLITTNRIVQMDIDKQSLNLVVEETINWIDESLKWDKNIMDDIIISSLIFNAKQVWMPPVFAKNVLKQETIRDWTNVYVWDSGKCWSKRIIEYTIPCTVNVRTFPYDVHNCKLLISQPLNWHERLKLAVVKQNTSEDMLYSRDSEHLEWELVKWEYIETSHTDMEQITEIEYTLILRRQAKFYFIVLILPCIVLNVLSLTIFTLPVSDTSRTDLCLSLILTYFVLIMIFVDSIPPSGNQIPLLGLYIILSSALAASTYGISVMLLQIHHHCLRTSKQLPKKVISIIDKCFCSQESYIQRLENDLTTNSSLTGSKRESNSNSKRIANWLLLIRLLNCLACLLCIIAHIIILCGILLH